MHRSINAAWDGLSRFHFGRRTISSNCTPSGRFMLMEPAILTLQILTTNSSPHFQKTEEMKITTYLQNRSTGISLVILSVGFSLLGILSFLNRHHDAEAASRYLNDSFCVAGSVVSLLTGATFLFAACLYWSRCPRIPVAEAPWGSA